MNTRPGDLLITTVSKFHTPAPKPPLRDPLPLRPAAVLNEPLAKSLRPRGHDAMRAFFDNRVTSSERLGDLLLAAVVPFRKREEPKPRPAPPEPAPLRPAAVLNEPLAKAKQALDRAKRDAAQKALAAHLVRYDAGLDKEADRIAGLQKRVAALESRVSVRHRA